MTGREYQVSMAFIFFLSSGDTLPPSEGTVVDDVIIFLKYYNLVFTLGCCKLSRYPVLFSAQPAMPFISLCHPGPRPWLQADTRFVTRALHWRVSLSMVCPDPCSVSHPHSQCEVLLFSFFPDALPPVLFHSCLLPYHTCSPKQLAAASTCFPLLYVCF